MGNSDARRFGLVLVTSAAILWSTAALFVRLLPLDVWTMLAWRSAFAALSLGLVVILRYKRDTLESIRAIGWPGVSAVPIAALSIGSYVVALKMTTVANVMVMYATVPFIAAGIAYCWMGERVGRRLFLASAVALLGVLVMASHATRPRDIAGNLIALVMTLAFAAQLVMARRFPSMDMTPVNAMGAALCAALCWPFVSGAIPTPGQLVILALFGVTTTALAYLLFLTGARHIPSGEAGLIGLLDVVLAPFWVWLAFNEQPGHAAVVGGVLVLAPVLWYLSASERAVVA